MHYKTFGPDAEVFGAAMLAFVQSINFENFSAILQKHGLTQIEPNRWYPQQIWLDVFSDITNNPNATSNMVSIGMKVIETAPLDMMEGVSFTDMMLGFSTSYTGSNRGADIGSIEAQVLGDKHILMVDKTPYPDDFVYGAYYAMARKFLPPNTKFVVKFDDDTPRREQGGEATLVHITWR